MRFGLAYDFRNPMTGRDPMTGERPWPEVFADLLDQIAYADTLGFDSVWITEHHFAEDGYAPSPMILLGAIAARTTRMQLSTDIALLPLYHAVRLAEDVATLDILSGGRAMLGVGMGYRDEEFEAFGQTRRQRVGRTEEGLDVLRGAWGAEPFSYDGDYYHLRDLVVTPKPVQRPHPPLWMAAMSEPAARRAARYDMHLLPQGDRTQAYEPWLDELQSRGRDPRDYRIGVIKPWLVCAGREDPLWARVRDWERYRMQVYAPWLNAAGLAVSPPAGAAVDQRHVVGPPDAIVEAIGRFHDTLPVTDLISWGTPVGMDPREVRPSLERFAAEVMPQLRDL